MIFRGFFKNLCYTVTAGNSPENVSCRYGDAGPCKELLRIFKENTEEQELMPVLYCVQK